jgi:hypothetical protein
MLTHADLSQHQGVKLFCQASSGCLGRRPMQVSDLAAKEC